ncbi:hypothetical protein Q7P35_005073 [Cladosporium inversicolor]
MSSLSGSSSPDPLHLASSPLAAHIYTRRGTTPIAHSSAARNPRASPSKSFLMDTGDARIKVTVEPVLYGGLRASRSPSKQPTRSASRTTTIPLRTGESSTTWLRQPTPAAHIDSSGLDVGRRSAKKRKSTPGSTAEVAERRTSRRYARMQETRNQHDTEHDYARDRAMFSEQSVPSSEVRRRRSLYPMRNQRSQRLSAARDDLDNALQAAIGGTSVASSDAGHDDYMASDDVFAGAAGELTTANEDFTMITGESLASISFKANASMLGSAAHDEDDEQDVQAEHLTSSPPQKVMYPDITEQADEAKTPMPVKNHAAMDWKPTGPEAKRLDFHDMQLDQDVSQSIEQGSDPHEVIVIDDDEKPEPVEPSPNAQTHSARSSAQPHGNGRESVPPEDVSVGAANPEDDEEAEEGDQQAHANEATEPDAAEEADDDIWAEEASRDFDDSVITTTTTRSHTFSRSRAVEKPATITTAIVPPAPLEKPDPSRRARLPRTWRKAGGGDSTLTDSSTLSNTGNDVPNQSQTITSHPEAHPVQRTSGDEAESGRSSGVLTPPSTDDDDSRRKLDGVEIEDHVLTDLSKPLERQTSAEVDEQMEEAIDQEDEEIEEDEEEDEGDISGFTNPGAADTQLEAHHRFGHHYGSEDEEEEEEEEAQEEEGEAEVASPASQPGSNASTPAESVEDTGYFWQKNLPQVYQSGKEKPQSQKRKPVDLSAILRIDSSKVEEDDSAQIHKPDLRPKTLEQTIPRPNRQIFNVNRKPALVATRPRQVERSPDAANGHILPSPVRRSLLRTSKVLDGGEPAQPPVIRRPTQRAPEPRVEETQLSATEDSLASKDADQRQLIGEMRATTPVAKKPAHERLAVLREASQPAQADGMSVDGSYEETDTTFKNSWPEHSYEEHLNIESPQKIGVNFNDSTLSFRNEQQHYQPRPDLLAPRGPIKPLFEKSANAQSVKASVFSTAKHNLSSGPSVITPVGASRPAPITTQQENEGVFTRLSTTFWSAVARSQCPPPTPAPFARTTEQTISLSLRAQLRSRYGVLPNSHPWTMAHMRTLHRMLNSLESGRRDSIVPTHAHLPAHLTDIIGEGRLSATGRSFRFEKSHACVVQAFLQLLVTPALFKSMEKGEVEWLGDEQAAHLRSEMGGRAGNDLCFKTLKPKRGPIEWRWIVECLGCCVVSNVESGMRRVAVNVEREGTVRDVEMSVMGDGQGDGRVREWFERDGVRVAL